MDISRNTPQPFQSVSLKRCIYFRNILTCCGRCNDCCQVIGVPHKNTEHRQRTPQLYWLIWMLIFLSILFMLGYGLSIILKPKSKLTDPITLPSKNT